MRPRKIKPPPEVGCRLHLRDLKRAHGRPPVDVQVTERDVVRLVIAPPDASWCSSPAQMCAELAERACAPGSDKFPSR